MQLFELFATLSLNSRGFESALGGATGKVGGLIKSLGLTTAAIQGVEKGFSKMTQMVSGAVDNFADYEQLVGGVETLFKDSSAKVQAYSKEAYKNAGLSANEYMAVTTNFSASLIKALNGDTETAAELSNMAIVDMSDNVNKMGSSMEAVQNAYRGFARGNFTMLDNLQLGYSGTKEGMVELINDSGILNEKIDNLDDVSFDTMIKAIHKVQENLGITGTTAEEAAKTISGSKASMKAAFDDLLTAVGIGDQVNFNEKMANFQSSFITYMNDNLMPTVINAIGGSGALVYGIFDAITMIPPDAFVDATVAAEHSLDQVFQGGSKLLGWIGDTLVKVITSEEVGTQTEKLGKSIGAFVSDAITWVGENADSIFEGLFNVGGNLIGGIVDGLFKGLFGNDTTEALANIDTELANATDEANATFTKTDKALTTLALLVENYGTAAQSTEAWNEALITLPSNIQAAAGEMTDHADKAREIAKAWIAAAKAERDYKLAQAQKSALEQKKEVLDAAQANFIQKENELLIASQAKDIYNEEAVNIRKQVEAQLSEKGINLNAIERRHNGQEVVGMNALATLTDNEIKTNYGIDPNLVRRYKQVSDWALDAEMKDVQPARREYESAEAQVKAAQEAYDRQLLLTERAEERAKQSSTEAHGAQMEMDTEFRAEETSKQFGVEELKAATAPQLGNNKWLRTLAESGLENGFSTEGFNKGTIESSGEELTGAIGGVGENVTTAGEEAGSAIDTAGGDVSGALESGAGGVSNGLSHVTEELNSFQVPSVSDNVNNKFRHHAVGLDYVPYDGYLASLHKGEEVLTAAEASVYRKGGRYQTIDYSVIGDIIADSLGSVGLYVSAERVANLTTQRTQANINQRKNHTLRGMGG